MNPRQMHMKVLDVRHGSILVCGHRKQSLDHALFYLDPNYHELNEVLLANSIQTTRLTFISDDNNTISSSSSSSSSSSNNNNDTMILTGDISNDKTIHTKPFIYQPTDKKYQIKNQLKIGIDY